MPANFHAALLTFQHEHNNDSPSLAHQILKVQVGEGCWSPGPRIDPSRTIFVAPPQCVCPHQCHDLLIVETHPIENVPNMFSILVAIWQATIWCAVCFIWGITPTWTPGNIRPCANSRDICYCQFLPHVHHGKHNSTTVMLVQNKSYAKGRVPVLNIAH